LGAGRKPTAWLSLGRERRSDVSPAGETARRWPARARWRAGERRGRVPPRAHKFMDIKFIQLVIQRNGKVAEALFEINDALLEISDRYIKIGVSDSFMSAIKTFEPDLTEELFLKQFGGLIIEKMVLENNLSSDYIFETEHFTSIDGKFMPPKEIKEKLENDIRRAQAKRDNV